MEKKSSSIGLFNFSFSTHLKGVHKHCYINQHCYINLGIFCNVAFNTYNNIVHIVFLQLSSMASGVIGTLQVNILVFMSL